MSQKSKKCCIGRMSTKEHVCTGRGIAGHNIKSSRQHVIKITVFPTFAHAFIKWVWQQCDHNCTSSDQKQNSYAQQETPYDGKTHRGEHEPDESDTTIDKQPGISECVKQFRDPLKS